MEGAEDVVSVPLIPLGQRHADKPHKRQKWWRRRESVYFDGFAFTSSFLFNGLERSKAALCRVGCTIVVQPGGGGLPADVRPTGFYNLGHPSDNLPSLQSGRRKQGEYFMDESCLRRARCFGVWVLWMTHTGARLVRGRETVPMGEQIAGTSWTMIFIN